MFYGVIGDIKGSFEVKKAMKQSFIEQMSIIETIFFWKTKASQGNNFKSIFLSLTYSADRKHPFERMKSFKKLEILLLERHKTFFQPQTA